MAEEIKKSIKNTEVIELGNKKYDIAFTQAKFDFPKYEEIKNKVDEINTEFSKYEVDTNNLKSAKYARAQLNKLGKALNDKKISIVKTVDRPVLDFKKQIKDLVIEISQASNHIGSQIKVFEDTAKKHREELVRANIKDMCDKANVDPQKIEFNPKWLNKSESNAAFEKEVNQQIDNLLKEKQQLSENIKVVTSEADKLGLPYQHWVEQLNSAPLSKVMNDMADYAEDVKKAAERDRKAKLEAQKEAQANLVNKGDKLVDKKTGEVKGDYHIALLITPKVKITLGGTQSQFNKLMKYLNESGFKMKVELR